MLFPIVAEFVIGTNLLPKKKLWYVTRRIGLKPILKGITLINYLYMQNLEKAQIKVLLLRVKN